MTISPVLFQNQTDKFPAIYQDYRNIKSKFYNPKDDSATETVPVVNRLNTFADKMANREYATAIGLGTLAVLNGPEELPDAVSAYQQLKGRYQRPYNNREAQHPFSFFRGTILNDYVNPNSPKCIGKKESKWLISKDKSLMNTRLGTFIKKLFNIRVEEIETNIPSIVHTNAKPSYLLAKQFITKSKFGELTARALTRTPVLSVAALGAIEASHIGYAVGSGSDLPKEIGKSALTLGTTIVASGYLGAIGAKYAGPYGSLLGIGLGSVLSYKVSRALG